MYNFIFWVLYQANIKDGKNSAKYNGVLIVLLIAVIHLFFLFIIIKIIFKEKFAAINDRNWYNHNKPFLFFIILFLGCLLYFYYNNNRIIKILDKYKDEINPTKFSNIIKIALLLFIPVIIGAIILTI